MAAGKKTAVGTELHALNDILEDITPDAPFSVYEDIRGKLISMGIPAHEIAFIHDANTDAKRRRYSLKFVLDRCAFLWEVPSKWALG